MDNRIEEFIKIRKKFKASRSQFGTVFLKKSGAVITNYETGITPIPDSIMTLVRAWSALYDNLMGKYDGNE